jgi:hypothetical protein
MFFFTSNPARHGREETPGTPPVSNPGPEQALPTPPFTPQEAEQPLRGRKRSASESTTSELSKLTGFSSSSSESSRRRRQKRSLTLWTPAPDTSNHDFSNYTVLKHLGFNGGNGNEGLAIVKHNRTNDILVRKFLQVSQYPSTTEYQEVRIQRFLSEVPHRNIVQSVEAYGGYVDIPITKRKSRKGYTGIIYMSLCTLGSLEDWFTKNFPRKPHIPEAFWWHVLIEMLTAITYLQTGYSTLNELLSAPSNKPTVPGWTPIAHMDAHSRNIFLTAPDTPGAYPRVLLGDFGAATILEGLAGSLDTQGRYEDVRALLSGLCHYRTLTANGDTFSKELRGILRLHLQGTDSTKDKLRFDIKNVASMIRDAMGRLDLRYVPLPPGAEEPSLTMTAVSI